MISSKAPTDSTDVPPPETELLIVGGGISGLVVGRSLQQLSVNWKLLEASPRLGGRLINQSNAESGKEIDMGGAWIWPDFQPHVRSLVASLPAIKTFEQPDDPTSTRIEGGAFRLIHELTKSMDSNKMQLNSPVVSCKLLREREGNFSTESSSAALVRIKTASHEIYLARKVVFAVPPKLLSEQVTFDPPLSASKKAAMQASQTWMAGVTKVALVYPRRFWDLQSSNMGLPSTSGPAFQVYDSSTSSGSVSALTFFALVPPNSPAQRDDDLLAKQVADQMALVWKHTGYPEQSERTNSFVKSYVQRWPLEQYISDEPHPVRVHPHPEPVQALSTPEWNGALLFAGSETDTRSPGVMEGAVGAANRVLASLKESFVFHGEESKDVNQCL
jgi:monoamine oxidase